MNCSLCPEDSKFLCLCKNIYLCSKDLGDHVLLCCGSQYEVLEDLTIETSSRLKKEVILRVKSIESAKLDILCQTKEIITMLENSAELATIELDILIKKYLGLLNLKKLSKSSNKEINDIFGKVLFIKFEKNNFDNKIKEAYSSLFIHKELPFNQLINEEKILYLERNAFKFNYKYSSELKLSADKKFLFDCKI